jgi:hypothetical protein
MSYWKPKRKPIYDFRFTILDFWSDFWSAKLALPTTIFEVQTLLCYS